MKRYRRHKNIVRKSIRVCVFVTQTLFFQIDCLSMLVNEEIGLRKKRESGKALEIEARGQIFFQQGKV